MKTIENNSSENPGGYDMKKIIKELLSIIMVFAIIFGAAPLSGFNGIGSLIWNGFCSLAVSAKEDNIGVIEQTKPENVLDISSDIISCEAGSVVSVPVRISNNTGIMGFGLTVSYNEKIMSPLSVVKSELLSGILNDSITTSVGGSFDVFWADSSDFIKDGELFAIMFRIAPDAKGDYEINIKSKENDTFNEKWETVNLNCTGISIHVYDSSSHETRLFSETINTTGTEVCVPIYVANNNGFASERVSISYNPEVFQPIIVSDGITDVIDNDFSERGMAYITLGSSYTDGLLFTIRFRIIDGQRGTFIMMMSSQNGVKCNSVIISIRGGAAKVNLIKTDEDEDYMYTSVTIQDNSGIMGLRLNITYDSSCYKPICVTRGSGLTFGLYDDTIANNIDGKFSIIWFGTEDLKDNGELFLIKYEKVKQITEPTDICLSFEQEDTYNERWEDVYLECISLNITNQITVGISVKDGSSACIDDENKIVNGLSDTPYCEDDILDNLEVVGTGATAVIVPTENGYGTGTIINLIVNDEIVDSYTVIIFGDATGDGIIDESDFVMIDLYNAMLYFPEEDSPEFLGMDCNRDGVVDESDIVLVDLTNAFMGEIDQINGGIIFY